ncbi:MAG: hypothetical protein AAF788_03425 [Pseudomonadota bacterium]
MFEHILPLTIFGVLTMVLSALSEIEADSPVMMVPDMIKSVFSDKA